MSKTIIFDDAIRGMKRLEDKSVDTCVTSPPYFRLRDYGVAGQIGLEDTPEAYIERLVEVFREVKRVLRDDGTLWIVIGDCYAGSGKGATATVSKKYEGIKPKDLIGIPWMLAFALRADGWYLRQEIIWHKPNPMPESVRDRCTVSKEYIFLLSKQSRYYFDAEAISEPVANSTIERLAQDVEHQRGSSRAYGKTNGPMKAVAPRYGGKKYTEHPNEFYRTKSGNMYSFRPRRNRRDVWTISTKPFRGAHFATFPMDLIEPCILAGSRAGGNVLDPFCGSGTTVLAADKLGRNGIGIELNENYRDVIHERIGVFEEM